MKFFGFGPKIRRWTRILFKDAQASIINHGVLTNPFKVTRGVKQGGPCSPYFFLILAETLSLLLRGNKEIKGFKISQFDRILGQFADDMDMYLLNDEHSVNTVIRLLNEFKDNSGFKINYDKTVMYRIGSLKATNAKYYTKPMLNWVQHPIEILGVTVSTNQKEMMLLNYNSLCNKTQAILNSWEHRGLSLIGKSLVINTLVASQFVYKMSVLRPMPAEVIANLEKQFQKFLWNGRRAKISLEKLKLPWHEGGINLVNIENRGKALLISWICETKNDTQLAELAFYQLCPTLRDEIWSCNISKKDVKAIFRDTFWREVLAAWAEINHHDVTNAAEALNQRLWYNTFVRINGKPIINRKLYKRGLTSIVCFLNREDEKYPMKSCTNGMK